MRRKHSGFTLLELLVLLGVLTVLAVWSALAISHALRQAAVREAASLVAADLRRVRSETLKSSQAATFSWSRESRETAQYSLESNGSVRSRFLPPGTRLVCVTCPGAGPIVTYTAPHAELAAAVGVVLRVEGAESTVPSYVKVVGVTGKVMVTNGE